LVCSLLAACSDDPPPPSEVRARITSDLGNVLREGAAASQGGASQVSNNAAFGIIDRMMSGGSGTAILPRLRSRLTGLVGAHADQLANVRHAPAVGETTSGFDADALTAELNDKLFSDANYQGDGIYKIPAELVCTRETFNDDGTTTDSIDADCAAKLESAQLRLRVANDGAALQIAVQVDANHDEPLVLSLTHDSLAMTLDLDASGRALTALAPLFGEEIPNTSLSGQLTGSIEVLGKANARFELTIDRPLAIKFADAGIDLDGAQAFRFTSAKADVASLTFDGGRKNGALVIGLGETTAHIPGDQTFDLDLPGVSLVAMLVEGLPLTLTHVGLGERSTTLSIDGRQAIAIDLNPLDGRAFGATIATERTSGLQTLIVSPKLDLRYAIDHAVLGDDRPVYDVTQLLLDGSIRGGNDSDRIEVLRGTFQITTNPAAYGFSATAGQCVTSQTVEDVTSGAFYDQWSAGACN
jgi:hypothetical protein